MRDYIQGLIDNENEIREKMKKDDKSLTVLGIMLLLDEIDYYRNKSIQRKQAIFDIIEIIEKGGTLTPKGLHNRFNYMLKDD